MDWMFWLKVGAFWVAAMGGLAWYLAVCKRVSATPTEQRVTLARDWQAQIRRDVHREGMRRASSLMRVVK